MPFKKDLYDKQSFKLVDNHFELSPQYMKDESWRFKKITATRLCGALGLSKYNSPFKTWCTMVNIYFEEMDPIVSKVGTTIEPEVRKFVQEQMIKKTGINFYYSFYEPKDVNWDCWKGKDDVFGGIPDGEPYIGSKLVYDMGLPLLEIKTSSIDAFKYAKDEKGQLRLCLDASGNPIIKEPGTKKLDWFNDDGSVKVSLEYKYQLGLYMYLRKATKGLLACCFVETKNYTHPEKVVVGCNNVVAKEITFDPKDMEKDLAKARDWYYKYIKTGISPEMTKLDKIWLEEQLKLIK